MTGRKCLESNALLPANRLSRRELFGVTAGLVAAGCSSAPKWETKKIDSHNGLVELELVDYPTLATPGGMVALDPTGTREAVLVMRIENDRFLVMSLRCPHLGCTVRWDNEMQMLICPCHGSKFDDGGRRLEGPAKENLKHLPAQFDGTRLQFKVT